MVNYVSKLVREYFVTDVELSHFSLKKSTFN